MRRYAEGTSVPVARSQEELRNLVLRVEARRVAIVEDPDSAAFAFEASGRTIRFRIALPQDAPPTVRSAWPAGTLQQLLARAANACKCGAPLEPLDGFACGRCREAQRTPSSTVPQSTPDVNQEITR